MIEVQRMLQTSESDITSSKRTKGQHKTGKRIAMSASHTLAALVTIELWKCARLRWRSKTKVCASSQQTRMTRMSRECMYCCGVCCQRHQTVGCGILPKGTNDNTESNGCYSNSKKWLNGRTRGDTRVILCIAFFARPSLHSGSVVLIRHRGRVVLH